MKTETFIAPPVRDRGEFAKALRALQPDQAIRVKTAAEWRAASSQMYAIGKKRGVVILSKYKVIGKRFGTANPSYEENLSLFESKRVCDAVWGKKHTRTVLLVVKRETK